MKTNYAKRLLLAIMCIVSSITLYAYNFESNGIYYNINKSEPVCRVTTGPVKYSGNISIPEIVTNNGITYEVKIIESEAFSDCPELIYIEIPRSVTIIDIRAIYNCQKLEHIAVSPENENYSAPEGVLLNKDESILYVYPNARGGNFYMPTTVRKIGIYAFANSKLLTSITFSGEITDIGDYAFFNCELLESFNIPNTIETIRSSTFFLCKSLKSVVIPNSVKSIENGAFAWCSSLTSIDIPKSVNLVTNSSFICCGALTSLNVDADNPKYSSVDGVLFNKNKSILIAYPNAKGDNYTVPENVVNIGEYAFSACEIKSVTLPNTLTSIGNNAFNTCFNLTSINIPNSVNTIGEMAFTMCNFETITLPSSITEISRSVFSQCQSLRSITIPPSVTKIGDNAFAYTSLATVQISKNVTTIGVGAFQQCMMLQKFEVDKDNPNYCDIDGVLCNKEKTILITHPNMNGKYYEIPNGIEKIEQIAFAGTIISQLTIPATVNEIGKYAFSRCNNLSSIFNYATTPQKVDNTTFDRNPKINIRLNVPLGSGSSYRNAEVWGDFKEILEFSSGVDAIGNDKVKISVSGESIVVEGAGDETMISVYGISGRLVYQGTDKVIKLPARGAYIVKAGTEVTKVSL
ncbi:MAG: leucine-rich repeat protein [Muribaculaceae bacterium]|nr:leucine-rich repeat protein [Muribaculaceae bacterium]